MGNTDKLQTITVKVPRSLAARVARAAKKRRSTRSETVRQLLEQGLDASERWPKGSVGEAIGHLFGAAKGGPRDLATNPKYMDDFGKWRRR
jgi:metal-responsive CopG/Arc/MetJ family transcriptional regulator